jgi:hypothetical protein
MPALKINRDGTTHIHTYAARGAGTRNVNKSLWICMHPDCNTLVARSDLLGKRSLCNLCHTEIILSAADLKRSRPRCFACSKTEKALEVQKVKQKLLEMGIE